MKRWKWITVAIGVLVGTSSAMATGPSRQSWEAGTQIIDNTTFFDANSMLLFVNNTGSFGYDKTAFFGKNDGGYFPKGTNKSWVYAAGIWLGAKVQDEIRVAVAEYSNEYVPGPMAGGTFQPDKGGYRVYKIKKGDTRETSPDYRDWPFEDGAPALKNAAGEDSLDAQLSKIPLLQGDQALWAVFNDADPSTHSNNSGSTKPLGVEVQVYVFGYARSGPLGQTIFLRWRLINKGPNTLDSTFVSMWMDPDLGDAGDDLVGCDTLLSLGFVYNSGPDAIYGDAPPSGGMDFFQGPIVPATASDSAWVSSKGIFIKGYKNLPMTSFNKYINGTDPTNSVQTFNYMRGLSNVGQPQTDPNGIVTKFVVAGDPVAGTGWIDDKPADRRMMMSSGPFTMAPGDTQEVVGAVLVGQGVDRLASITDLKRIDRIAQSTFDLNFKIPGPPPQPTIYAIPNDGAVQLLWGTEADGNVQFGFGAIDSTGQHPIIQTFVMEGFNVYQGSSSSGPWTKIATFDVVDGVQRIYNYVDNPAGKELVVVQHGTDNGLTHDLWVTKDRIHGGSLINNQPYYFTVTSYNYDTLNYSDFSIGPNSFGIISESFENLAGTQVATVNPRSMTGILADTVNGADKARHIAGKTDGFVLVDYYNQDSITGNTYQITFNSQDQWTLRDMTKGINLLVDEPSTISSKGINGMIVRVTNPPPGMKDWSIPSGTRRFTWNGATGGDALGLAGAGFNDAIGFDCPCFYFGGCADPCVAPGDAKTVLLKLAKVDALGNYDPNDPNVSYGYRYLRGAQNPPAKPEFGPFIKDPSKGSYGFQDFEKSVPLSAWDMDATPPRRLVVGFLENNSNGGLVDGKYWPPTGDVSNTGSGGPREWLWIYDATYSETGNPAYEGNALEDNMPIMIWSAASRRGDVPFSPDSTGEDQFLILANHVITPIDTFQFVAHKPGTVAGTVIANSVEKVHPVPNPYYDLSKLELDQFRRIIKFVNIPAAQTTVRIFNLAGDLVRTLTKTDPGAGELIWDTLTDNGLPVASGLYIYHVEAQGMGTKVGKMAVFTEVEQLNTY